MDRAFGSLYPVRVQPGRFLLRTMLTALQQLRRALWRAGWPRPRGVLVVPLTPEGRLILVRLTYARGWQLPGGGIGRGEDAQSAALRELAEEIGMNGHGEVIRIDVAGSPGASAFLFLVRDVRYVPRRSLEIEEIAEFAPDSPPPGATRITRLCLAAAKTLTSPH